jgi:hypothetical protein
MSLAEFRFGHSYHTVTSLHVIVINLAGIFHEIFHGNFTPPRLSDRFQVLKNDAPTALLLATLIG